MFLCFIVFTSIIDLKGDAAFNVDKTVLFQVFANCRVYKSPEELKLMAHVSKVTSWAHVDVMRATKGAIPEYQLESLFRHHIYTHAGCRNTAYTCICACGPNSGTLHYGHAGAPNDRTLAETDVALLDMGAEYHAYCSDITCRYVGMRFRVRAYVCAVSVHRAPCTVHRERAR